MRLSLTAGPLAERSFRLLFLGQAVTVLGGSVAAVAIVFAVLDVTGSASSLGLVLAARTAALVLLVLAGGVWADRLPRQLVMLGSELVGGAAQALLAVLILTGAAELWHFIVLASVQGAGSAFFRPAAAGLVPQTVPPDQLQQANALLGLANNAAGIAGPPLGGILVAVVGSGWAVGLDAATFFVSAVFLAFVRPARTAAAAVRQTFLRDLRLGFEAVRSRLWLWTSIVDFGFFQLTVLGTFFVLGPVLVDEKLGGAPDWGLIVAGFAVGALLGSAVALRVRVRHPLRAGFLAIFGVFPGMLLLPFAPPVLVLAGAQVLAGAAISFADTLWGTTLQRRVPGEVLSRVVAYDWMGSSVLRPLGYTIAGPAAAAIGAGATLWLAAGVQALVTVAILLVPEVRNLTTDGEGPQTASAEPA